MYDSGGNSMKKSMLVALYLVLSTLGLVLMKLGQNTGELSFSEAELIFSINLISLAGFISYILSFLLYTNIIVKFDLGYITPITAGILQIATLLAGIFAFKENISINGIIGIIFVITGVIIMNIKSAAVEKKCS